MRKVVILSGGVALAAVLSGAGCWGWTVTHPKADQAGKPTRPGSMVLTEGNLAGQINTSGSAGTATASATPTASASLDATPPQVNFPLSSSTAQASATDPASFSQFQKYQADQTALYQDLTVGNGAAVQAGQQLTVNYRGWLTNGQVFDESYKRGQPFTFTLGQHRVIAGWEEGLMGMKVGGKRRLVVPPAAGYGSQATGSIPANSVLIFDVELISAQ